MYLQNILRKPADKICDISNKHHIYDGSKTYAVSRLPEHKYQYDSIDKQLPGSKALANKTADSKIHRAERIDTKACHSKKRNAQTYHQYAYKHHGNSFSEAYTTSTHFYLSPVFLLLTYIFLTQNPYREQRLTVLHQQSHQM